MEIGGGLTGSKRYDAGVESVMHIARGSAQMNGTKNGSFSEQVRRFRARFVQSAGSSLGKVITGHMLRVGVGEESGNWRERLYGPLTTVVLFIEQVLGADHSCQGVVAQGLSARVARGQAPCSLNTGPYCKARQRLAVGLVERLAREIGTRLLAAQPVAWLWRGRNVKLLDGTTVSMPDTPSNQTEFPQPRGQKLGLGFPIARLVGIVSLSCGAVLEWAVGPCEGKKTGETAMLWGLMDKLCRGDVVIADRYFAGYFGIARLWQLGVDVLIRQHQRRQTDFRRGRRLGKRDHVVIWARPQRPSWMDQATYATMPETIAMREVRVANLILVTTLLDAEEISKLELVGLYGQRWQIELDFRSIKTVMQMEILRCKSPEMIQKEIAAHLLAYNLVRTVMAQAACFANVFPRQLSFKATLQVLNAFEENLRFCPHARLTTRHGIVLASIAQAILPVRPNRVEPRAVKRRPKPQKLLTEPRRVLQKRLRRQQERHAASALR